MNYFELMSKIKNILTQNDNVKKSFLPNSIYLSIPQSPISNDLFPIIIIHRPNLNQSSRRGSNCKNLLSLWNCPIYVSSKYGIDAVEPDYEAQNELEQSIVNALLDFEEFNDLSNNFYGIEFTDYVPDEEIEKPFIAGTITFTIYEKYSY